MEPENRELQHSVDSSEPANRPREEISSYNSSMGDVMASSAAAVKEMVLSRVSVTGHIDGAFSSANTSPEGKDLDSGGSKTEEEDNDKGVIESVGDFISPTVTHHVKEVMNTVAGHGEGGSGKLIADAAALAPEPDEASILIDSIIRD